MKAKTFLLLFVLANAFIFCSQTNKDNYLETVLNNLEKIESATYQIEQLAWNPYDDDPVYDFCYYVYEYHNPVDTTIGASFVSLKADDTTLFSAYDGNVRIVVWDESKTLGIDNFSVNRFNLPFRLVSPPFYNYTKNIIKYILTTSDSITVDKLENDNYWHVKLTIHEDRQVEFFGKAYKIPDAPMFGEDPTSIYEIWIDKKTNLPYKFRREMSHNITESIVSNPEFNKMKIEDFHVSDYFPSDYKILSYNDALENRNNRKSNELEGRIAPDFELIDTQDDKVSLQDMKSKAILLQFTGIGCGPCYASIQFMEKISKEYPEDLLTVASIETWSGKIQTLQNYKKKNQFTYLFLKSEDSITQAYNAMGVPQFFILNEKRVITKVFEGYAENTTDNEIRKEIDGLLNK